MAFIEYHKGFKVEIISSGKRDIYGDRIYEYKIISKLNDKQVKNYCIKKLKPCYHTDELPTPYDFELIKFENITNDNNGLGNMFHYIVRKISTA